MSDHRGPRIAELEEEPYVGIRFEVTEETFRDAVDSGFPELFGWLGERGIEPAAAPFIRYLITNMDDDLVIELSVPVADAVEGDQRVTAGALPAGPYVTLLHKGPFDGLREANAELESWAESEGIALAREESDRGPRWVSRFERYITNPREEPDSSKWQTEISIKTT